MARSTKKKPKEPEPECLCLGYESSDDDGLGMEPCVCGHSPEEHTFAGCEHEPPPPSTPESK